MSRRTCPHCQHPVNARTSQRLSRLSVRTYYQCTNVYCGHTFVGLEEMVYSLSPSAVPDPTVTLPLRNHKEQHHD